LLGQIATNPHKFSGDFDNGGVCKGQFRAYLAADHFRRVIEVGERIG